MSTGPCSTLLLKAVFATQTHLFSGIFQVRAEVSSTPPPDSSIQHSRASSSHCGAGLSVMKWGLLATQRGKSLPGFSGPLGSALDLFLYIHWVMPLAGLQILPKTANNRTPDIPGVSKHSSRWFQDRPSPQSQPSGPHICRKRDTKTQLQKNVLSWHTWNSRRDRAYLRSIPALSLPRTESLSSVICKMGTTQQPSQSYHEDYAEAVTQTITIKLTHCASDHELVNLAPCAGVQS